MRRSRSKSIALAIAAAELRARRASTSASSLAERLVAQARAPRARRTAAGPARSARAATASARRCAAACGYARRWRSGSGRARRRPRRPRTPRHEPAGPRLHACSARRGRRRPGPARAPPTWRCTSMLSSDAAVSSAARLSSTSSRARAASAAISSERSRASAARSAMISMRVQVGAGERAGRVERGHAQHPERPPQRGADRRTRSPTPARRPPRPRRCGPRPRRRARGGRAGRAPPPSRPRAGGTGPPALERGLHQARAARGRRDARGAGCERLLDDRRGEPGGGRLDRACGPRPRPRSTAASTRGWSRRCSSSRSSGSPGWRPDGAVGTVMERDSATRAIVSVISMGFRPH